ncbi:hypothetical protein EJB05_36768 [Eragrostis curvula]|uniref:Uncharacterized protein n=1 Tax=Eragrostis curvula TaxID=38414 RepID=A0A5J9UAP3_9POAL|nr:hypothetical protein EJB05_36768 [Eragrostis curvula]
MATAQEGDFGAWISCPLKQDATRWMGDISPLDWSKWRSLLMRDYLICICGADGSTQAIHHQKALPLWSSKLGFPVHIASQRQLEETERQYYVLYELLGDEHRGIFLACTTR